VMAKEQYPHILWKTVASTQYVKEVIMSKVEKAFVFVCFICWGAVLALLWVI